MTNEEKLLLLQDLSARLPYGVIVDYKENEYDFHHWKISTLYTPAYSRSGSLISTDHDGWIAYEEYDGCSMSTGSRQLHLEITLPFLRSMSSMTKEEREEYQAFFPLLPRDLMTPNDAIKMFDFLNSHHFDYRGLIEKGLAIKVTEDNNPYKG